MHPNSSFRWDDRQALCSLIEQVGFGMIFATTPDGPRVAHVPLLLKDDRCIQFHLARGNALTKHLANGDALCVVNGPDAYISPDWYGLEDQVPTWNYLSVELEGSITKLDNDGLVDQIDAITERNEKQLDPKTPWNRYKMRDGLFDKMLGSIVGFELDIKAWRSTAKLGQNKSEEARESMAEALDLNGRKAMAHLIREGGK